MSNYIQGVAYAITYDIWISGTKIELGKKECINSISIQETTDGADTATVRISDPKFLFIEDNVFAEDNTIKIELGWDMLTYKVKFDGFISAIDIDFESNGIPVVTMTCMDNTHKMNREKHNETFKDCTSADVVKKVVQKYGYTAIIEGDYEFKKQETITQSRQTDIDFLTKLANDEVHPFTARLVGNEFHYEKTGKLKTPAMELTYLKFPHEIISFSPKINKETKQEEIENSVMETKTKEVTTETISAPAGSGSASPTGDSASNPSESTYNYNESSGEWTKSTESGEEAILGKDLKGGGGGSRKSMSASTSDKNTSTGKTEKEYNDIEINTLVGSLEFIATDETIKLKAGDTVKLNNLGKYLSGDYFVKSVSRVIGTEGYSHSAEVIKTDFGGGLKSSGSEKGEKVESSTPAPAERTYTVKKGDCLWAIAKQHYGNGADWKKIYEANQDKCGKPYTKGGTTYVLIHPGQVLTLP